MKKLSLAPIALVGLGVLTLSAPAFAVVEFDQNVTPDVIMGTGIANGGFTTDRNNGVELGLRTKQRFPAANIFNSNGDGTYSWPNVLAAAPNKAEWSYEWTINIDQLAPFGNGLALEDFTYELGLDTDPGLETSYTAFDPIHVFNPSKPDGHWDHSIGDNTTANGGGSEAINIATYDALLLANNVAQQSWQAHWYISPFDPTVVGTYSIYLLAKDGGGNVVARTEIQVLVGGAPPVVQPIVDVVSYDMPNGSYGGGISGVYADNTYDGAGSVTTACDPLSGGTGELTDGTLATAAYANPNWVGWASTTLDDGGFPGCPDPTIDFNFLSATAFETVTIHAWDAGGDGGIVYPASISVTVGANAPRIFPLAGDGSGVDSLELPLGGDVGDTVSVAFEHGGKWLFLTEVSFNGYVFQPVAADDSATLSEDDPATTIDVLANDDDDGGPAMSIASVDTNGTIGSVVITNNGADLTYEPAANYCNDGNPTDDFTYTLAPGGSFATVAVTVTCVDDPPVAVNDTATVTEDDPATVIDVLANDTDVDGGPIAIDSVTQPANGTVVNNGANLTYQPDANYCNDGLPTDDFTYTLTPGGSTSTVAITVTCINDPPVVTTVSPAAQTADYSDVIGTVTITATDVDDTSLTLVQTGAPASLPNPGLNTTTSCTVETNESIMDGSTCTWTMDGQVDVPGLNTYNIDFTASDDEPSDSLDNFPTTRHVLTVEPEDATVLLSDLNDATKLVDVEGDSPAFSFLFTAWETNDEGLPQADDPDFEHTGTAADGDFAEALGFMNLVPVGPGAPIEGICTIDVGLSGGVGYGEFTTWACAFDDVPVNVYEVVAEVDGAGDTTMYYYGLDEDVFTVYDPSLGFTTGGGWFYWPDTADGDYPGDKTNFGFNMQYNRKQTNLQGSFLLMRHTITGENYRVKSNALDKTLAVGAADDGTPYDWAAFSGKSTYRAPGVDNEGNYPFLVYVEDHGEQGCNQDPSDDFWIEVKDKDGFVVLDFGTGLPPVDEDGTDGDDTPIECGNIYVPHKPKGGKP